MCNVSNIQNIDARIRSCLFFRMPTIYKHVTPMQNKLMNLQWEPSKCGLGDGSVGKNTLRTQVQVSRTHIKIQASSNKSVIPEPLVRMRGTGKPLRFAGWQCRDPAASEQSGMWSSRGHVILHLSPHVYRHVRAWTRTCMCVCIYLPHTCLKEELSVC